MYGTYITSVTVGAGGASSIAFSSIPATYTDLILVVSSRTDLGGNIDGLWAYFNGSVANFSLRVMVGNGSSVSAATSTNPVLGYGQGNSNTSNVVGSAFIHIPNYAEATNKNYYSDSVGENNATTSAAGIIGGTWANSSAINAITLFSSNGANFLQYSAAYLYGLTNGSGGATVS